ncbi:MAG TPA: alpha/beta hydrolase [Saprospiraceae bacterium]|nr:alpha/beta hydrolase [Saprospiraceae bacterium]HMQ82968.1 alpha/beta hydrolase [Saprospiraceae bacterium]
MYLKTPWGQVHYQKYGKGSRLLIAFHGFAHNATSFRGWSQQLSDVFTIYAIDIPFHGATQWQLHAYGPGQLQEVIKLILKQESQERFEAVGYSLGGRLWLAMLDRMAHQVDGLYLLAPDGLATRWSAITDGMPLPLRRQLSRWSECPDQILKWANILSEKGWLHQVGLRYLQQHLQTDESRARLFGTWCAQRWFKLPRKKLLFLFKKHKIPTLILLGKKDPLINSRNIKRLFARLRHVRIVEMDAGHFLVNQEAAQLIRQTALLKKQ